MADILIADDLGGLSFEEVIPPTLDVPIDAERVGTGQVSLAGTIPAGTYNIYVGPNGDATDPQAFNGTPGSGSEGITITTVSGSNTTGTMYLPELPVGGPYNLYLIPVGGGDAVTVENAVTVYPASFGSKTLSLRKLLPNFYDVGPRKHEQESFPQ